MRMHTALPVSIPPAKLLLPALCHAGAWKPAACCTIDAAKPKPSEPGNEPNDVDSDDDDDDIPSKRLHRLLNPPAPSGRIAAWLVCRDWRDALRGSAVHLAAALIAAHGPEQALVRAVRCKSAHTQPLALVQEVLRQCGPHLPCLEPAFIEVRRCWVGRQGFLPPSGQLA